MNNTNDIGSSARLPLPSRLEPRWAFFLDVDGTLLDHADDPANVIVTSGLHNTLQRLSQHIGNALALVSGRSMADLDRLFAPFKYPAAGQHGLEVRNAEGRLTRSDGAAHLNKFVVNALLDATGPLSGVLVEDKGLSVALHYRRAPYLRNRLQEIVRELIRGLRKDLQVIDGNMAFEIKPAHVDKGVAIRKLMDQLPFFGRIPVYAGDDTTDEDGFSVVNALGGLTIKVGAGRSLAQCRASNPSHVRQWLAACAAHLDG